MNTEPKKRGRGAVTDQQKRMAATLIHAGGITASSLAAQTGVNINTAKAWLRKHKAAPAADVELNPVRISEVIDDLQRTAAAGSEIIRRHMEAAHRLLLEQIAKGEVTPASMRDIKALTETMGSVVIQMKSLQGEPTSISTVLDASPDQLEILLLEYVKRVCDEDPSMRERILETLNAPKPKLPSAKQTDPQLVEEPLLLEAGDDDNPGHDGYPGDPLDGYPGLPKGK